jgi:hypothetical protein
MAESALPKISIITSCYNAGSYVESTIRSVVEQKYPTLEYIFMDGASKDNTLEIANRYKNQIAVIKSEKDKGQYHGIQNGSFMATGDVMAWLNGDDTYYPWTLSVVGEIFKKFPDVDWLVGTPSYMNSQGQCTRISGNSGTAYPQHFIKNGWFRAELAGFIQQESMFWRRSLWEKVGGLDVRLTLAADFDLWRRFAEHAALCSVNIPLALFRLRPGEQRSSAGYADYMKEVDEICQQLDSPPWIWNKLGGRGEKMRHIIRMLIWRKAQVISYSNAKQTWIKSEQLRPLARTSISEVLLERTSRS